MAITAAILIVGAIVLNMPRGGDSAITTVATKTTTVTVTKHSTTATEATNLQSPTAQTVMNTDGTYVVGKDVQPGTYKSAPTMANGYPFCTWKRLSDFSGSMDSTIAIDNSPGQTIVTIAPTDVAFQSLSCQPWEPI